VFFTIVYIISSLAAGIQTSGARGWLHDAITSTCWHMAVVLMSQILTSTSGTAVEEEVRVRVIPDHITPWLAYTWQWFWCRRYWRQRLARRWRRKWNHLRCQHRCLLFHCCIRPHLHVKMRLSAAALVQWSPSQQALTQSCDGARQSLQGFCSTHTLCYPSTHRVSALLIHCVTLVHTVRIRPWIFIADKHH